MLIFSTVFLLMAHWEARGGGASYRALRAYGGDFTLTDHDGKPYSLQDARGKVVLIYFGFTSCAETCPLTLAAVGEALHKLGPLAEQVQPILISVDPARDTPEVLRGYVTYFHPSAIGLTGTQQEILEVARQYRAPVNIHKPGANGYYTVDHSSYVFVVDREGTLVNLIRYGTPSDRIAETIRALLENNEELSAKAASAPRAQPEGESLRP
jgi:protein SCO1/2